MSRFTECTYAQRMALLQDVESIKGDTLEAAAQNFCGLVHSQFEQSVALVRLFGTVPLGQLPVDNLRFVQTLAASVGISGLLGESTPVLSLLGTRGKDPDWNDRRKSRGHIGIPLVSAKFVESIPMLSRLLKQVGLDLAWINEWDTRIVSEKGISAFGGTFYVADAKTEKDSEGRNVIAAQDFVAQNDIKTVFGFGGRFLNAAVFLVAIVFTNEAIEKSAVEPLQVLINGFKMASMEAARKGHFFSS
jgi:hypothetical protein